MDDLEDLAFLALLVIFSAFMFATAWRSEFLSVEYFLFSALAGLILLAAYLHMIVVLFTRNEPEYQLDSSDYKFIIESLDREESDDD